MGKLLEELKNYLNTASPEQLEKDWEFIEQFDNCGPTVEEFIKNYEHFNAAKTWVSRNYPNESPEEKQKLASAFICGMHEISKANER